MKGWNVAIESTIDRARRAIEDVETIAANIDRHIKVKARNRLTHSNLVNELEGLEQEFDTVTYGKGAVSAITESIVLDGHYLGPFKIKLPYCAMSDLVCDQQYRIEAVDPRPAASNDAVTHPHIQDTVLCEGDAVPAIRQALADGRICDFFVLVRSVLQTYNPYSAYVQLGDWGGVCCGGCDECISPDDCYRCTNCDVDRCSDCITFCVTCDEAFCEGCVIACSNCSVHLCSPCTQTCPGCGETVCSKCQATHCPQQEEECDDYPNETPPIRNAASSDADPALCA